MARPGGDGDDNAGRARNVSEIERRLMDAAAADSAATLAELGGREAVTVAGARLSRSALLPELARTLVITASEAVSNNENLDVLSHVVLDGLNAAESALAFAETLDVVLDSSNVLKLIAEQLNAACLSRVAQRREQPAVAGFALEGALRIVLGGWVPEYDVLGVLVRLREPESHLFSRPALRCLGVAYELWRDERLAQAMTRVAGLNLPVPDEMVNEVELIESDAAVELGHVAVLDALTAPNLDAAKEHLNTARRRFAIARADEDRVDARLMAMAVDMLTTQLPEDNSGDAADEAAAVTLTRLADELVRTLEEHQIGYVGLDTWRGARLDAEVAWVGLAHDVAATAGVLTQRSWYAAARTLTDVLAAYQATRCAQVLSSTDVVGLQALLAPRITQGIGRNAALLTHLEDHVRALESAPEERLDEAQVTRANAELSVARQLLEATRAQYAGQGRDTPKSRAAAGAAAREAFPLLNSLLGAELAPLAEANPGAVAAIEVALAEQDADSITGTDSLILSEIFADCQRQLADCRDYRGEIKQAFDHVLLLLLRFIHFRAQRSQSRPGTEYLFRSDALEKDLAYDVELFLASSEIAYQVHTEVRDIGGGRVDVAVFFAGFTLVCELKREYEDISVAGQHTHLMQAAAYQDSDVALGFLLVLDLKERTGPPSHLRANVRVIVLDNDALGGSRYVVMLVVPGNRRSPSSMR